MERFGILCPGARTSGFTVHEGKYHNMQVPSREARQACMNVHEGKYHKRSAIPEIKISGGRWEVLRAGKSRPGAGTRTAAGHPPRRPPPPRSRLRILRVRGGESVSRLQDARTNTAMERRRKLTCAAAREIMRTRPHVYVAKSEIPGAGLGLFAAVDIGKGRPIAEYDGVCGDADVLAALPPDQCRWVLRLRETPGVCVDAEDICMAFELVGDEDEDEDDARAPGDPASCRLKRPCAMVSVDGAVEYTRVCSDSGEYCVGLAGMANSSKGVVHLDGGGTRRLRMNADIRVFHTWNIHQPYTAILMASCAIKARTEILWPYPYERRAP